MFPAATVDLRTAGNPADPGRATRRWWTWLLLPSGAVAVLVVILNHWNQYTSDSVAQQSLVRTWLDVGHGTSYVPSDTWIFKLPLYAAIESLPLAPAVRLVIEVLALQVACFALLAPATWLLARTARPGPARPHPADIAIPLLWLATLGGELGANRMQPNYRNVELGLSFLALAAAAHYLDTPRPPSDHSPGSSRERTGERTGGWAPERVREPVRGWALAALAALALALLWVDDLYFALLVGVPFIGACVAWLMLRRRWDGRLIVAAGVVTVSLVLIYPLMRLLDAAGLQIVTGSAAPHLSLQLLMSNARLLWPATEAQLALADADPQSLVPGTGTALSPLAAVLTAGLMLAGALAGLALGWLGWRQRKMLPVFLGLHWVVVLAGFCLNSRVTQVAHGRYLILAWYDLAVCLAMALPALRARSRRAARAASAVVCLLVVSSVLNVAGAVSTAPALRAHQWDRRSPNEAGPSTPEVEQELRRAIDATGLRRGYAQFWSANLSLYLSGGRVSVNAVRCARGRVYTENWLTDTARRRAPSNGTFLLIETRSRYFKQCSLASISRQFGPADRVIPAGPGAVILTYTRDIGPLIRSRNVNT